MTPPAGSAPAAFYTVADAKHFIGVLGLLNSLRVVGHSEPFVLVDCGLEDWQRDLVEGHATVLVAPPDVPPMLLKAVGPLERPAPVMALLDADVIVTRSLGPLLEAAARGKIVAFANDNAERFFDEWAELGLGAPRRQAYVASGHLFVRESDGLSFLELFHEAQNRIDMRNTLLANAGLVVRTTPRDPFYYPDMDVLNAVLATRIDADRLLSVDYRLAPHAPFPGVSLENATSLSCRYDDGVRPFLLHHVLRKPWLAVTSSNVYSRLLTRLLLADDVEVRLDPARLPLRLRGGQLAAADRLRGDVQAVLRANLRGRLGIRPRVAAWRAARSEAAEAQSVAARGETG